MAVRTVSNRHLFYYLLRLLYFSSIPTRTYSRAKIVKTIKTTSEASKDSNSKDSGDSDSGNSDSNNIGDPIKLFRK